MSLSFFDFSIDLSGVNKSIGDTKQQIKALKAALTKAEKDIQKIRPSPKMVEKITKLESQLYSVIGLLDKQEREYERRKRLVKLGNVALPILTLGGIAFLIGSTILLSRWKDKQLARKASGV
jgi:hypothetical protein